MCFFILCTYVSSSSSTDCFLGLLVSFSNFRFCFHVIYFALRIHKVWHLFTVDKDHNLLYLHTIDVVFSLLTRSWIVLPTLVKDRLVVLSTVDVLSLVRHQKVATLIGQLQVLLPPIVASFWLVVSLLVVSLRLIVPFQIVLSIMIVSLKIDVQV